MVLSLAGMEKLLKSSGADRVSQEAAEALRDILEKHAKELGEKACKYAKHAGRKTLKGDDIRLASKA